MKIKLFKYKIVNISVIFSSSVMLLLIGIGAYDLFNRYGSSDSSIDKLMLTTIAFIFLLKLAGLISVIFKFVKSILLLNIFYIFSSGILLLSLIRNYQKSSNVIDLTVLAVLLCLTFLVNKFKYKEMQYESIEEIGTQND